jgi:cytidine deaminase
MFISHAFSTPHVNPLRRFQTRLFPTTPIRGSQPPVAFSGTSLTPVEHRLPISLENLRELAKTPLDDVTFQLPSGQHLSTAEKQHILKKLIDANLLALGHQGAHPLRSGTHTANIVEMDNGTTGKGVNTEGHVELSVCAERAAIVNAVLSSSEKFIHDTLKHLIPPLKPDTIPKVKRTFQAGDRLQPCSECLPWMQAQIFYTPNTESYILKQYEHNDTNGQTVLNTPSKWVVECRRVKDMLPIHQTMAAPYTHKSISTLPILPTPSAQRQMRRHKVSPESVAKLLSQTKESFLALGANSLLTPRTARNMVASVLLSDGTTGSAPYIEIRRYSHSFADFAAFNIAMQKSPYFEKYTTQHTPEAPKIRAIAYYGTNADFPTASQLNSFSHRNWGGPETLIITPSDQGILVRTIQDYLPYNFNEDKLKPSKNGGLNAHA